MQSKANILLHGYGSLIEFSSTATLLITDQTRIVFDTGARTERANLLKALAALNLRPEDIDIVANTHLHMDHCENNSLFPKACFYCSDAEFNGLMDLVIALNAHYVDLRAIAARYLALPEDMPKNLSKKVECFLAIDRVPEKIVNTRRVLQSDLDGLGVRVIPTPGHTDGHASFVFHDKTANTDLIITGDVIPSQEYFQPGRRTLFNKDPLQAEKAKEKLAAFQGWFFPGHGKAFFLRKGTRFENLVNHRPSSQGRGRNTRNP